LSYWFFFGASIVMFSSLFVQTGPAAGGWTIYPPLSALGQASEGSKIGMDLWQVSMCTIHRVITTRRSELYLYYPEHAY
jgi:cytochrome c oxidase subunit 1